MVKSLDAFRFFAFLAVFFFHLDLLDGGYLGVQGFFVLSGFLLTPILLTMKKELNIKDYLRIFWGRRFLRIFPLYFAYLIIGSIITGIAVHIFELGHIGSIRYFNEQLAYALTYTYDFLHVTSDFQSTALLTHFWSLAVEEQFYIFWPFVIWFCPLNRVRILLWIVILFGPILRGIEHQILGSGLLPGLTTDVLIGIYVLPFSHLDGFAIGSLFAISKHELPPKTLWLFPLAVLFLGYFSQYLGKEQFAISTLGYPSFMKGQLKCIWGYSLVNLAFGFILLAIKNSATCPRIMNFSFIQYLGKISYGLYIFHYPVILTAGKLLSKSMPKFYLNILFFIITSVLATISYELFEKKFLLQKDRWFAKTTAIQAKNTIKENS